MHLQRVLGFGLGIRVLGALWLMRFASQEHSIEFAGQEHSSIRGKVVASVKDVINARLPAFDKNIRLNPPFSAQVRPIFRFPSLQMTLRKELTIHTCASAFARGKIAASRHAGSQLAETKFKSRQQL